jgi:hypothetical protein
MGYVQILTTVPKGLKWRQVPGQPEVGPKMYAGSGMLYGYELVTLASRLDNLWRPLGFFRSCVLGLRRAWEITRDSFADPILRAAKQRDAHKPTHLQLHPTVLHGD